MVSAFNNNDWIFKLKGINSNSDVAREEFRKILSNSLIHWDIDRLEEYFKECKSNPSLPEWLVGGIGFLLFTVAVDIAPLKKVHNPENLSKQEKEAIKIRDSIFKDFLVYKFIVSEYNIESIKGKKPEILEYETIGTTSYILKMKFLEQFDNNEVAVKILKYKYFTNPTINNETRNYISAYQDDKYIPTIYDSNSTFIIMKYISGETLHEFIQYRIHPKRDKMEKGRLISMIINELCKILTHFAREKRINHNDLNANNIIIHDYLKSKNSIEIYLIDFGVNYLLNEKIGSSHALDKVGVYISNEVLTDSENVSIMSDIYSLGVLLLQMLNEGKDFENRRFDDYLDTIRLEYPVLASILDDVLDKNPDMRLFDLQKKYKNLYNLPNDLFSKIKGRTQDEIKIINHYFSNLYEDLQDIFKLEFDVREIDDTRRKNRIWLVSDFLSSVISGQIISSLLGQSFPKTKYFMDFDDKDNVNFQTQKKLGIWEFIAKLSNLVVWGGFLFLLAVFIGYQPFFKFRSIHITDLVAAFVLLTFSVIAVNYYKNIFSSLYTKNLDGGGSFNNKWLRLCTYYWPIPILFAFYHGHQWWAYVASFGTFIVSANNFLNYKLAKLAKAKIQETFDTELSQTINDRLKDFKDWWKMMLGYSLFLLVIGILLNNGILKDELAYLVIVLFVNFKMYLFNCTDLALNVTKTLTFLYTRYNRALKYEEQISKNP